MRLMTVGVLLVVLLAVPAAVPARAQESQPPTFVGPASGGGWKGAVLDDVFVYRDSMFKIVKGRVSLPDCATYAVSAAGQLTERTPVPDCQPGQWPTKDRPTPGTERGMGQTPVNPIDMHAPMASLADAAAAVPELAKPDSIPPFVGPGQNGVWQGKVAAGFLLYRGGQYPIRNGVVTFPDCSTYVVAADGALKTGAPVAVDCSPVKK